MSDEEEQSRRTTSSSAEVQITLKMMMDAVEVLGRYTKQPAGAAKTTTGNLKVNNKI